MKALVPDSRPTGTRKNPNAGGRLGRLFVVAGARLRLWAPAFLNSSGSRTTFLIVGLVVQMVLLWLLGELVSLCISLFEVWAELAAKHLEITLDTTG